MNAGEPENGEPKHRPAPRTRTGLHRGSFAQVWLVFFCRPVTLPGITARTECLFLGLILGWVPQVVLERGPVAGLKLVVGLSALLVGARAPAPAPWRLPGRVRAPGVGGGDVHRPGAAHRRLLSGR